MARKSSVNKGIQANNVTADMIGIGDHARVIKNVQGHSPAEFMDAVKELHRALVSLNLDDQAYQVVKEDVDQLQAAAQKETPNRDEVEGILKSIAGKLKMVGVVLSETEQLIAPVKKIGSTLGSALSFLGI